MHLLLIGPEVDKPGDIKSYGAVWSYFLSREFRQLGVDISFSPQQIGNPDNKIIDFYRNLSLEGIDHVLAIGVRYFERVPYTCGQILRDKFDGLVTQIYDGPVLRSRSVDCTFMVKDSSKRYTDIAERREYDTKNCYIGWAADPELCAPNQPNGALTILIDHPHYIAGKPDRSESIQNSIRELIHSKLWHRKYRQVWVTRIEDDGFVTWDPQISTVPPYHRQHIAYEDACIEYSKTRIFMVTHPESLGLTVLETAMAGALPVVPEGFIAEDRLSTVRHLTYTKEIPWPEVLHNLDIVASRGRAILNNWRSVANRILDYFSAHEN